VKRKTKNAENRQLFLRFLYKLPAIIKPKSITKGRPDVHTLKYIALFLPLEANCGKGVPFPAKI